MPISKQFFGHIIRRMIDTAGTLDVGHNRQASCQRKSPRGRGMTLDTIRETEKFFEITTAYAELQAQQQDRREQNRTQPVATYSL